MKLVLRNHQAPGDVLMLTAAVRDLHAAHPGRFVTAVETPWPELWENNPLVVAADQLGTPDRVIDCGYPLIRESNRRPFHFIHGFAQDLERQLGVPIPAGPFKGDLYLSAAEREWPAALRDARHTDRYWVVVAGGKFDYTAKWWDPAAYQAVIDHFGERITFVQCGAQRDWHAPLTGVVNLVGKTTLRELIRVIYQADGVLCPVTLAMHLAAAVPARPARDAAPHRPGPSPLKPCVVVAGGREPAHWEMYPGHQFLHTIGALDCCATGGCWKSRCTPVGDGEANDTDLCLHPVPTAGGVQIGRCMAMITPQKVISAIESYYEGGVLAYPPPAALPRRASPSPANAPELPRSAPMLSRRSAGVAVTIGVGPYARLAHLAAREVESLTGLTPVILGDDAFAASGLEHPDFLKFRLFDLVDAENIFFFDADIVCLERWDPAAHFGSPRLVCVRDSAIPAVRAEATRWGLPAEEYFNAGFFIASRAHHAEWLRRAEAQRFAHPTDLFAQSPLNAARYELGIPLCLLDRRYNWVRYGGSSLSHDTPVVMAHKLAPNRHDLNVAFFEGRHALVQPRLRLNPQAAERVAGKSFTLHDEAGTTRRSVHLRHDGTVLPLPQSSEDVDYWIVHDVKGRPRLALANETRIVAEFVETFGGAWVEAKALDQRRPGARLVDADDDSPLTAATARPRADAFLRSVPPYPGERFAGRGVVIPGGGDTYFPCAWVCIRLLRHVGCNLPIELWLTSFSELDDSLRRLVEPYGVRCVDANALRLRYPVRSGLTGWELKPYALLHCAFREALLLDADNVPVRDPGFLFDAPQYRAAGAAFWPDSGPLEPDNPIWEICNVPYREEPSFESGQVLIDKQRCWRALQLTMHLNDHSDFYYRHLYGDKDTFHFAWRMLGQEYAMVPHPLHKLWRCMCQHDFDGRRLFQHRHRAKWHASAANPHIEGFELEDVCLSALEELSRHWRASPARAEATPAAVCG